MTARCLIALSNVVQSSFNLTPAQLSMLKDPIVTAGNERLRFEGFSNCAGVYARVDVLPDGHDGEFLENGTTNVDFNAGMISALGSISKQEKVVMSVGPKEVGLYNKGEKVIERKVPLPVKWIKGLDHGTDLPVCCRTDVFVQSHTDFATLSDTPQRNREM